VDTASSNRVAVYLLIHEEITILRSLKVSRSRRI